MVISPGKWLICYNRNESRPYNLVCFPFGGAAASVYRGLATALSDIANVWCVQLPGRENRFAESFALDMQHAIKSIAEDLSALKLSNYAIFGHSMGSDMAVAFYRWMGDCNQLLPFAVVVSGNKPPHKEHECLWSKVSDKELLDQVIQFGGLPEFAINDREFVEMYLKKIRADYTLYESADIRSPVEIKAPLTVIYGDTDPLLERVDMSEWSDYASRGFDLKKVSGGHFYFQDDCAELAGLISAAIKQAKK